MVIQVSTRPKVKTREDEGARQKVKKPKDEVTRLKVKKLEAK